MNTKLILVSSAIILGIMGIVLSFLPSEILTFLNQENTTTLQLFLQIIGALYLGFAMLNWMSKGALIGGIYNRPVAVANMVHFLVAGLALIKGVTADKLPTFFWLLVLIYTFYAILFGLLLFQHPLNEKGAGKN